MRQSAEPILYQGLSLLARHIKLFLLLSFMGSVAGIALSYTFSPLFRADATLIASDEMLGLNQNPVLSGLGGLASLVGIGTSGNKESEAIAILKSRALTTAYIQTNDLLPIIFHDRWNSIEHKWKSDTRGEFPTLEDGYRAFDRDIRGVIENRKTGLITIFVAWEDPKLARQWVDGLVNATNEFLRRQAIERSTKNLEYLQSASDRTSIMEIKATIYKLMETEIKKQMLALGNKDYAFRVVDPAVVPERKAFPKRSIFAACGAIIGSIGWFLVVAFKGRTNS